MSDNEVEKPARRIRRNLAVSSVDFVRFLEEKTPDLICPGCGSEDWTIISPPEPPGETFNTYRIIVPLRDGEGPMSLSTFAIHCDNCGYLRQHLSRVVKKWVIANPAPNAEDNQLDLTGLEDEDVD